MIHFLRGNGGGGLQVPLRDATALAAVIMLLQDKPAWGARLEAVARERAVSERIVIEKTIDVYRVLVPGFEQVAAWGEEMLATRPA